MRKMEYDGLQDNKATATNYPSSFQIINAPNGIPSLSISLEPNQKSGKLTVEDLIERIKNRYPSLGLNNKFPADKITIMVNGAPYNLSNKGTQIYCNGTQPNIRILFPPKIDDQFKMTTKTASETTSLTGGKEEQPWYRKLFS